MNRKLLWLCALAVCLPPLAGSLFFAKYLARRPDRNPAARSALARDALHSVPKNAKNPASQAPLSLPVAFEPNVGQANSNVAFIGRGRGLTVLLERREIAVQIAGTTPAARAGISRKPRAISLRLAGAAGLAWQGQKNFAARPTISSATIRAAGTRTSRTSPRSTRQTRRRVPASSSTATTKASNTICGSRRAPVSRPCDSKSPVPMRWNQPRMVMSC